ncbi:MAG: polysaccharide deacetylase family protein [Bacteroidetes bacterium]|nr:polysaccharide deacetylase family protein [Bacteroidota bacterium]
MAINNNVLFALIRYSGLTFIIRKLIQRNKISIVMFHKIEKKDADKSFFLLSKYYNFISLNEFLIAVEKKSEKLLPPYSLIVTFDDGHASNFELLPLFIKHRIKPTIFLCSGIVNTFRHYWFSCTESNLSIKYLNSLSNENKLKELSIFGFYPKKVYEFPQALAKAQICEMKEFVDFQSHTIFHPSLPNCTDAEAQQEITKSKTMLENDFQLKITSFAYPNGDFSEREVEMCKNAGYKCAITVDPGYNSIYSDMFKLKRFSVNDSCKVNELLVKASGLWAFLKMLFPN